MMVMIFVSGGAFKGGSSKETWTETEEDAQSWGEAGQVIYDFYFSELIAFQSKFFWLQSFRITGQPVGEVVTADEVGLSSLKKAALYSG